MKGVVFLGERQLEIRDFPDPEPGPREVVLEIKASGMCGSDLRPYRNKFVPGAVSGGIKRSAEPVIAGHEPCGVVAALGSAVTEREAQIGQRVMDHHYQGCGVCKHCQSGWAQMLSRRADCVRLRGPRRACGIYESAGFDSGAAARDAVV